MMRTCSLAAVLFVTLGVTASWAQPTTPLLVSGETTIGILDTDMDGMPDPPDDCSFKAFQDGNDLFIDSMLGSGIALQACSGDYMADTSTNGGIGINFTSAPGVVGSVQLPTMATFFGPGGGGGGAGNNNHVMPVDHATIELEDGTPVEENASGDLCSNGGPAVIVRTTDGTTILFALNFFPSAGDPEFLKLPKLPLETTLGEKVLVDGYIPVNPDGTITVMRQGAEDPFVEIPLTQLKQCGGPAVPTMNELGLIVLMLGLLAGGVWVLRKRTSFANSLSML